MWEIKLILILLFGLGLWYLLTKLFYAGKKSEQLERLKREIKERARANEIVSNVINLNHDELNNRMYDKRKAKLSSLHTKDRLGR